MVDSCRQPVRDFCEAWVETRRNFGRHILQKEAADSTRTRVKILELVEEFLGQRDSQPERVKFKARIGTSKFEKLIDYSDMCELIEEQTMDDNGDWVFLEIIGHTTPKTRQGKPKLLVKWESGEITLEPTINFHRTCNYKWIITEYARYNGLVDEWDEYWPSLHIKKNARNTKKILRQINAAKIVSYKNSPVYMYGHQVPRNHQQALEIDRANGNDTWQQSEKKERDQLKEYDSFIDKGPNPNAREHADYKKINLHFVYAVCSEAQWKIQEQDRCRWTPHGCTSRERILWSSISARSAVLHILSRTE
eukprot:scaffold13971_cov83-Skeletonema_dohrnii-CCMP3373.AAC.1